MTCTCVGQKGGRSPAERSSRSAGHARSAPPRTGLLVDHSPVLPPSRHGSSERLRRQQGKRRASWSTSPRDTELARNCLQVFAAQQPQHRRALALSRHPATAAERRYARLLRSLRLTRPRSNDVRLLVHGTPLVRKSSACEVSQSTVMRGTTKIH